MAPTRANMRMNKARIRREEGFIKGALGEIMVADYRRRAKHLVESRDEPEELSGLVVGENGEPDFERHTPLPKVLSVFDSSAVVLLGVPA